MICASLTQESITVSVDFPFEVTLQHAPMGLRQMFQLCELLDFHELRIRDADSGDRFGLIVDLLSLRAEQTRIQIKPREPMSYDEIADSVELLLQDLEPHLGSARVMELNWLVERKGVASDMRSSQQRVH